MLSLTIAAAIAAAAPGQCSGGRCAAVPVYAPFAPVASPAPVFTWRQFAGETHWCLYHGETWLGSVRSDGVYFRMDAGKWSDPCEPPHPRPVGIPTPRREEAAAAGTPDATTGRGCACGCAHPCRCADCPDQLAVEANHGIDLKKLSEARKGYSVSGRKSDKREALDLVERRSLTDDSAKGHVVYTGPEPQRFTEEIKALPAAADWHVVAYKPEAVMAKARGYATPGVVALKADGTELARAATYEGPEWLRKWLDRLKDGKPLIQPNVTIPVPTWVWVVGALLLGYAVARRNQVTP